MTPLQVDAQKAKNDKKWFFGNKKHAFLFFNEQQNLAKNNKMYKIMQKSVDCLMK